MRQHIQLLLLSHEDPELEPLFLLVDVALYNFEHLHLRIWAILQPLLFHPLLDAHLVCDLVAVLICVRVVLSDLSSYVLARGDLAVIEA